jgi:hypothetical protein
VTDEDIEDACERVASLSAGPTNWMLDYQLFSLLEMVMMVSINLTNCNIRVIIGFCGRCVLPWLARGSR